MLRNTGSVIVVLWFELMGRRIDSRWVDQMGFFILHDE
jgi:hypothetical protein